MTSRMKKRCNENEEGVEQRKGPWTLEEDTILTNYIAHNGEGRWNVLAKSSGNILVLLYFLVFPEKNVTKPSFLNVFVIIIHT